VKRLDLWLQTARIEAAAPYIPAGANVLDIGAADGVLFRRLGHRIAGGVGIDPDAPASGPANVRLLNGRFPEDLEIADEFDAVIALAVFEHVEDDDRDAFVVACFDRLKPGGRCILTIPSPLVDHILTVLVGLRIIDGMHEGEHHGFDVGETPAIFERAGFDLLKKRRFQLGLNNLFVFSKPLVSSG